MSAVQPTDRPSTRMAGVRRLARAALLGLLLLAAQAPALHAQTPVRAGGERAGWSRVRIAKWTLLGVAAGVGGYAIVQTSRAQKRYDALGRICVQEPDRCQVTDGRYDDAELESLYRASHRHDRRAQQGIVLAQVALFGSVGLFIYDLRNERGPDDIPYPSLGAARPTSRRLALGASVRF